MGGVFIERYASHLLPLVAASLADEEVRSHQSSYSLFLQSGFEGRKQSDFACLVPEIRSNLSGAVQIGGVLIERYASHLLPLLATSLADEELTSLYQPPRSINPLTLSNPSLAQPPHSLSHA